MLLVYSSKFSFSSVEKSHTLININEKYFWSKIKSYCFDGSLNPTHRFFPPIWSFCGKNVNFLTPSNHFSSNSLTETTRDTEGMKHLAGPAFVLFMPQVRKQEQDYSGPEWNQKWERGFLPRQEASWRKTTLRCNLYRGSPSTPAPSSCDFAIHPEYQHLKTVPPNFCFLLDMSKCLVLNSGSQRHPRRTDRHIGDAKGCFQFEPEVLHFKKTNEQHYLFTSIWTKEKPVSPLHLLILAPSTMWPRQLLISISPGPVLAFTHRNSTAQRSASVPSCWRASKSHSAFKKRWK